MEICLIWTILATPATFLQELLQTSWYKWQKISSAIQRKSSTLSATEKVSYASIWEFIIYFNVRTCFTSTQYFYVWNQGHAYDYYWMFYNYVRSICRNFILLLCHSGLVQVMIAFSILHTVQVSWYGHVNVATMVTRLEPPDKPGEISEVWYTWLAYL